MGKEKIGETTKKVSPFRPDGASDLGPQGGFTEDERNALRLEETREHNRRVVAGEGLYNNDHPGF